MVTTQLSHLLPEALNSAIESVSGQSIESVTTNQFDSLFVSLTPSSDLIWGGFAEYQLLFARAGNDTFYGFDQSLLDASRRTQLNIDLFIGDSEPIMLYFFQDLLNTLGGNPPSLGNDRFVLGDWRHSFYTNSGYNDFAFIFDFNPKQDTIQLHGSAQNYEFVSVPFLGTAIFQKSATSPYFWDGELVSIVFWNFNLDSQSSNIKYVGNTALPIVEPKIKQFGTAGVDLGLGITTDSWGNIYVTGITNASLAGNNKGSYDNWFAKYDSDGNQLFIKQFGSSNYDSSNAIATDKWGNIYVVGGTQGNLGSSKQATEQDAWLAKYDNNGNLLWTRQFGSFSLNGVSDLDIDENGDIYISGLTLKPDPRPDGDIRKVIDAQDDFWVAKYDTNGNQKWFTEVSVPITSIALWDEAYGVKVGRDGFVYATGWTYGDYNGNPNVDQSFDQFKYYDAWITKFDKTTGQFQWIQQFGTPTYDFAWDLDIDSKGNIYSYGWTKGDLGGQNSGNEDLWLVKYESSGKQVWTKQFGSSGIDTSFLGGIKIDANDNIFLTGYTNSNLGGTNVGDFDAFVARYDSNGNQVWIKQFGTAALDYTTNLAIDNDGYIYVTGYTEGSFGSVNAGAVDTWVAKLDANTGSLQTFNPSFVSEPNKIAGTSKKDRLTGTEGNDEINGQDGSDTINGKEGDDQLFGGLGNDILIGGLGNDKLVGGPGNDTLTGSEGSDRFIFNTSKAFNKIDIGVDKITDFTYLDKIVLSKTTFTALQSSPGEGFNNLRDFAVVSNGTSPTNSTALIVYDSTNGSLYYNQNRSASGFGSGGLFATLEGRPNLSAADFRITG